MARESVVDQNRFAGRAEHDVARLDVEMDHVLPMQVVQRSGNLDADLRHFFHRQRCIVEARAQRLAADQFHHDVRLHGEVAGADVARHVDAFQLRHDHLLDFEADDRCRIVVVAEDGNLHQQRFLRRAFRLILAPHAPQRCHAALVEFFLEHIAIDHHAGLNACDVHVHRPSSSRLLRLSGRPATRIFSAAAS